MTKIKMKENRFQPRLWYYRFSQVVVGAFFRVYFRHQTYGLDNVPLDEGAVIATNHASVLDPPMIGVDLPRPIFSMAKQSLHKIPLFGSLIRAFHSFPVKRGVYNRNAMEQAIKLLKAGNLVVMFPEGTRSRDGEMKAFRPGIGKIVKEAGCGVLPGYLEGTFEAWPPGKYLPRPRKTALTFGKMRYYDDYPDQGRKTYRMIANDVCQAVKGLQNNV
ncbi:MAG: lysophospholipid acyltransferase family protein [bacterium]